MLEVAQSMGRLSGKPKLDYYAKRSQKTPDELVLLANSGQDWHGEYENPDEAYNSRIKTAEEKHDKLAGSDLRALQAEAKKLGLNSYQKSAADLREMIARMSDLKEKEDAAQHPR